MKKMGKKKDVDRITKTDLKSRGWTEKMISHFLPNPDMIADNPYYRCAPDVKLYDLIKVETIESSREFIDFKSKLRKRIEGAEKAVETKYKKLKEEIDCFDYHIPVFEKKELLEAAIKAYNNYQFEIENYDKDASINSDWEFLIRITNNYIRHNLTDYEDYLYKIEKRVGKYSAYYEIRKKMDSKIKEAYPWLEAVKPRELVSNL